MRWCWIPVLCLLLLTAVAHAAGSYDGELAPDVRLVLRHKIDVRLECTLLGRTMEHPVYAVRFAAHWANPRHVLLYKRIEAMWAYDWVLGGVYVPEGRSFTLPSGTRFVLEYEDREVRSRGVLLCDGDEQTEVYDLNECGVVIDSETPFLRSNSGAALIYLWFDLGSLPTDGMWSCGEPLGVRLECGGQSDGHASAEVP